ncbi:hypothetical protein ACE38W_08925 [Chitinophaga sp. Hz27]|uniref:hypothetical protein n=1 Tax=Chitinophaga sp. Hz27 TaxID=3347169 RepID=UPI0035DFD3BA
MKPTRNLYLLWHYYRAINIVNYIISLLIALLAGAVALPSEYAELNVRSTCFATIEAFIISVFSAGFLLSLFSFGLRHKNQYYFYHNKGYSKYHLIGFAYGVNLLAFFLFLFIWIIFF